MTHRTVWITGASSGIGAALVDAFVRRGARVAVTARRADLLEAAAARHGADRILVAPADVTDRAAVHAAADTIRSAWGPIDLAIFNAGGAVPDDFVATMALNYFGVVHGIEAVVPSMIERGSGHIAAVASLAGYRPLPVRVEYGAAKAAVDYLMKGLRFDLEPRGVRVTVINPGFVRTPLTDRNRFRMPFLVDADAAATTIVNGLERGAGEIHFPWQLSWPMKLLRVVPYPVYAWMMKRVPR